jgi:Protein of unknown function (DUF2934)
MSFCITLCSVPFKMTDLPHELYGRPEGGSWTFSTVDTTPNDRLRTLGHLVTLIEFFEDEHDGSRIPLDRFEPSLKTIGDSLCKEKIEFVKDHQPILPIMGPIGWENILIQLTPALAGALGAVLGAWLQQRGNRRLRFKVGDKEFEARTTAEIEALTQMASQLEAQHDDRDRESRIEALANQLWILRGKPIGSPEVDRSRAEEMISKFGR